MDLSLKPILESLISPPGSALLLLLGGALLRRALPGFGRALQVLGALWLWLASTPVVAGLLLGSLQQGAPLPATGDLANTGAQAIVVLSAEADTDGHEWNGPVTGPVTMQRVRYAASLAKRTKLPVLVSGGRPKQGAPPLADLMAQSLEQEFAVPVRWREGESATTWDNAELSARMLAAEDIQTVLLVTHAWHMPRAQACFQRQGLKVVPAPTAYRDAPFEGLQSLLPQWSALKDTTWAMHEWLGLAWYRLRHGK